MNRRDFIINGGALATASVGSIALLPEGGTAPPTATPLAAKAASAAPSPKVIAQPAVDTLFQMVYLPHEYRRGSLDRATDDTPLRVIFHGFGARQPGSGLESLQVEAGYLAPDASVLRHQLWSHAANGTSSSVRLTLSPVNFIGFFAGYSASFGFTKKAAQDLYPLGGTLPVDYGSYILAGLSARNGQRPDWSQITYSGNPARPLASSSVPIDFDYVSFEITRLAV